MSTATPLYALGVFSLLDTPLPQRQPHTRPPDAPPSLPATAGDILFYAATPGHWQDRLIVAGTHGPYVHCAVAISATECVEALTRGVVRRPIRATPDAIARTGVRLSSDGRRTGMRWLLSCVGDRYSMTDIALDALLAVLPAALGSRTPFLVLPSTLDCSELATRFLVHAGYTALPDDAIDQPERVSPNGLARILGVLRP